MQHNWLKNIALLFSPFRSKTQANHDSYMYSLALQQLPVIISSYDCLHSLLARSIALVLFYDTQLKSALIIIIAIC